MWLDTHNNYCIQNSQNRDQPYLPLRWVFYRLNNVATWSHCTVPCLLPLGTASHLCGVQPKILLDFVSMDKKTFNSRGIELSSTLAQISFREKAMTPFVLSFARLFVCLLVQHLQDEKQQKLERNRERVRPQKYFEILDLLFRPKKLLHLCIKRFLESLKRNR